MSYKSTPFDYEPVTRRGKRASEERELEDVLPTPRVRASEHSFAGDEDWEGARSLQDESHDAAAPSGRKGGGASGARAKKEGWVSKRGHAISFAGLFLFTVVLYFRPYELFESLSSFKTLAFWIAAATIAAFVPVQLGLEGTLTGRSREVNLVLLLALLGLVGVPFAIDTSEAWATYLEFLKVVLMFVVLLNVIRTEGRLRALIFLGLAAGVMMSVGVIADYSAGVFKLNGQRVEGLIGGMFGNPNDMALFLLMMVPLAAAMLLAARGVVRKVVYGACALLMVAGILVTFSRGGFFGLVCVLLVLAWKVGRRHRLSVIACSLLAGGVMMALLPGGLTGRLASVFGAGGNEAAESAVSRWALLLRSLWVSVRHPVLGVGMGTFHNVSIREQVSHNAYTQVSAEMGAAALVIYVMLMVTALRRLREVERETLNARRDARFYYLAVGLQASIVGYMVSSFFASVAYLYYVYYPVGYAFCLYVIYKSSREGGAVKAVKEGTLERGVGFHAGAALEPGRG
jgi:putative inorganic carbon (hco3(-)) transporter